VGNFISSFFTNIKIRRELFLSPGYLDTVWISSRDPDPRAGVDRGDTFIHLFIMEGKRRRERPEILKI
jgi:hypothetical protein